MRYITISPLWAENRAVIIEWKPNRFCCCCSASGIPTSNLHRLILNEPDTVILHLHFDAVRTDKQCLVYSRITLEAVKSGYGTMLNRIFNSDIYIAVHCRISRYIIRTSNSCLYSIFSACISRVFHCTRIDVQRSAGSRIKISGDASLKNSRTILLDCNCQVCCWRSTELLIIG